MKPHSIRQYGLCSNQSSKGSTTYYLGIASTDVVTCSTLVKGDFTTPNPYSYECRLFRAGPRIQITDNQDRNPALSTWFINRSLAPDYNFGDDGRYDTQCADADAYASLCEAMRGSDVDLSVDLFQYRSNVRMLNLKKRFQSHLARAKRMYDRELRKLMRLYKNARTNAKRQEIAAAINRLRETGVAALAEQANSAYLEWLYGWKPIVEDFYGLAKVHTGLVAASVTKRGKAQHTSDLRGKDGGTFGTQCSYQGNTWGKVEYEVKLRESLTPQVSSYSPLTWVWEAIPYSFVVDWFFNISAYLQSLETFVLHSNNVLWCRRTAVRGATYSYDYVKRTTESSYSTTVTKSESYAASKEIKRFDRTVGPLPMPPRITFRFEITSGKLAHGFALAAQRLFHLRK